MSEEQTDSAEPVFTRAWADFDRRLAVLLGELALPTLHDQVRLYPPAALVGGDEIVLAGLFIGPSMGVVVSMGGWRTVFHEYRKSDAGGDRVGLGAMDAAREISQYIQQNWGLPHPELIAGVAEGWAELRLREMGIRSPGHVLREDDGHQMPPRRPRATGGEDAGRTAAAGGALRQLGSELVFATSVDQLREAVESVLDRKYGEVRKDADGDYRVDSRAVVGTDFFLTVMDDRPLIRLWKVTVEDVRSRRAAIIEANYLNRAYPLTRWVLWGHDLVQEIYVAAAPFSPSRLEEMLDTFVHHHNTNDSALRLRLGIGSE